MLLRFLMPPAQGPPLTRSLKACAVGLFASTLAYDHVPADTQVTLRHSAEFGGSPDANCVEVWIGSDRLGNNFRPAAQVLSPLMDGNATTPVVVVTGRTLRVPEQDGPSRRRNKVAVDRMLTLTYSAASALVVQGLAPRIV